MCSLWKAIGRPQVTFDDLSIDAMAADDGSHPSTTPYTQLSEPPPDLRALYLVPLVVLLGVGAHATQHALAPIQPALEDSGLSPLGYAAVTLVPTLGQLITPALWGVAYGRRARAVLRAAPFGLLGGQCCIAAGLAVRKAVGTDGAAAWVVSTLVVLGTAIFSVSRAGLSVCQHATLARLPARSMIAGLCVVVAATHVVGAVVSYGVPRLLHAHGLLGVQSALLVPAAVGVAAGFALAAWLPPMPRTPPPTPAPGVRRRRTPFTVLCRDCGRTLPGARPFALVCDRCSRVRAQKWRARRAVLLLGLWRMSALGLAHAFSSVTSGLLFAHGLSMADAGSFVASAQALALLALPPLAVGASAAGLRRLLFGASALLAIASGALLVAQEYGDGKATGRRTSWADGAPPLLWAAPRLALALFFLCSTAAPVLPLALIPSNVDRPANAARAYGQLDTLMWAGQAAATLALGAAREVGGFRAALRLVFGGFAWTALLSLCIARALREPRPPPPLSPPGTEHMGAAPPEDGGGGGGGGDVEAEEGGGLERVASWNSPSRSGRHGWSAAARLLYQRVVGHAGQQRGTAAAPLLAS